MGLFSLTKIFGITIRESANDGSDFTNPDADYRRLFLGEDGQLHAKDSAGSVTDIGTGGGGASVATVDATLSGDVTMTTANTFYDGPSASFAAGTWLIVWAALFETAGTTTHQYTAKLWDGSTVYDEKQNDAINTNNGHGVLVNGQAIVTLGGTTTLKVSGADTHNSQKMLRDPNANSSGNHTASRLVGYKVT